MKGPMNSRSGKVNPEILLVLAIVALACYMAFSVYETNQKFAAYDAQIKDVRDTGKTDVKELADQLGARYLQLLKLAEDLAMQQSRMVSIERTISLEKDSVSQLQDTLKSEVDNLKKERGEQSDEVAALQDKFKNEITSKEQTIAKLQGEFESLKTVMDDQSALLVMIREQAILNSSGAAAAAATNGSAAAGAAPPGSEAPQSFHAGAIVPIPSTDATPATPAAAVPSTQPPAPVMINNAETVPGRRRAG